MNSIKTAVSLPAETFRKAEALRRKKSKSRSSFYADALKAYLEAQEVREMEARYEAGYRARPETEAEKAQAEALFNTAAGALEPEDW